MCINDEFTKGKDGTSLRLRPGQNRNGHPLVQHLERLRELPEECRGRWFVRGKSKNISRA